METAEVADSPEPDRDELLDVLRALDSLQPDDQEILRLAAWEELTSAQIAEVLGCSRGAAKVRLHRARQRLTAALECFPRRPDQRRTP